MGTLNEDQDTFLITSRSFLLTMIKIAGNVVNKRTHILCSITFFFILNRAIYGICGKILYSQAGHRRQYGACALHAG